MWETCSGILVAYNNSKKKKVTLILNSLKEGPVYVVLNPTPIVQLSTDHTCQLLHEAELLFLERKWFLIWQTASLPSCRVDRMTAHCILSQHKGEVIMDTLRHVSVGGRRE